MFNVLFHRIHQLIHNHNESSVLYNYPLVPLSHPLPLYCGICKDSTKGYKIVIPICHSKHNI